MGSLPPFLVWDEWNGERESADRIEAVSARHAAQIYGERDSDGQCDGLYVDHRSGNLKEQPIMVEWLDGRVDRFLVSAETRLEFSARFDQEVSRG